MGPFIHEYHKAHNAPPERFRCEYCGYRTNWRQTARSSPKEEIVGKLIMINPDKCTGCKNCELACSFVHERQFRPGASRVQAYTWEREGMSVPMLCQQCDDAACVKVCPTGAMHRSSKLANLVEWNEKVCIRCKMCTVACPFGNARYDGASSSIFKCDTCMGAPECVTFCPNGALEYVEDEQQVRSRKKAFAARFKNAFQEVS